MGGGQAAPWPFQPQANTWLLPLRARVNGQLRRVQQEKRCGGLQGRRLMLMMLLLLLLLPASARNLKRTAATAWLHPAAIKYACAGSGC